jgi:hypothetical protein
MASERASDGRGASEHARQDEPDPLQSVRVARLDGVAWLTEATQLLHVVLPRLPSVTVAEMMDIERGPRVTAQLAREVCALHDFQPLALPPRITEEIGIRHYRAP